MKFLVLVCALLSAFAYAQENVSKDPQNDLYLNAHTAASVVDATGTFENIQKQSHNLNVDPSCPNCNLHGGIDLIDENGDAVTSSDGSKVKTGSGAEGTIGQ